MDTIYSASLLRIFGWRLLLALLALLLGVVYGRRWRQDGRPRRHRLLGSAIIVGAILISQYLLALVFVSVNAGTRILTAELTAKRVVADSEQSRYSLDFARAQSEFTVSRGACAPFLSMDRDSWSPARPDARARQPSFDFCLRISYHPPAFGRVPDADN